MADLDKQLEDWYQSVNKVADLSVEQKSEITGAGAKAYAKILKEQTPRSDINYSKRGRSVGHANAKHHNSHRKTQHLADMITFSPGDEISGAHTGTTSVGWDGKYYAFLAKIINNGKKGASPLQISEMHFKDKAEIMARNEVLQAMAKKYKEVIGL